MRSVQRMRRVVVGIVLLIAVAVFVVINPDSYELGLPQSPASEITKLDINEAKRGSALEALTTLDIKGRAPKTGYERTLFGSDWVVNDGCDTRNLILYRDLQDPVIDESCRVLSGMLDDPYTAKQIAFRRGVSTSAEVQIDHVVSLSDAWQKGARNMSAAERLRFANDPLELLAVDGDANQQKSSGDAATWLPPNKPFRCQYVARQVAVKQKYTLWVTQAEYDAIARILSSCPDEPLPVAKPTDEPV